MTDPKPPRPLPANWADVVSRREFDLFLEEFRQVQRRLNDIDTHGTRGTGVMEQKILDLTGDVASLREREEQSRRDRAANRKWIIGLVFTVVGAIIGVLTFMAQVLQQAPHH